MSEEIFFMNQETLPLTDMMKKEGEKKEDDIAGNNENAGQEPTGEETVEEFSYEGYEVVRGEFFAHLFEPSVTFNDETIIVYLCTLIQ
jgi:hypothetical protein